MNRKKFNDFFVETVVKLREGEFLSLPFVVDGELKFLETFEYREKFIRRNSSVTFPQLSLLEFFEELKIGCKAVEEEEKKKKKLEKIRKTLTRFPKNNSLITSLNDKKT